MGDRGSARRFVAERNLARLARWLRAAGEDVADPPPGLRGRELSRWAAAAGRIVLTRAHDFPHVPARSLLIGAARIDGQLAEFFGAFPTTRIAERIFTRCLRCNDPLLPVELSQVAARLDPRVRARRPSVQRCPCCDRLYWEGTHTDALRRKLRSIRPAEPVPRPAPPIRDERVAELRAFLEELGFCWRGYRRKRRKVRLALLKRIGALGLTDLDSYRRMIDDHPQERRRLHQLLGITVTRFFRDRVDWEQLADRVLQPWLAALWEAKGSAGQTPARRAWSMGCAGGEEPYSLRMLWLSLLTARGEDGAFADALEIVATDARSDSLQRARAARYPRAARHHIGARFADRFVREVGSTEITLTDEINAAVRFEQHDYLLDPWPREWDLILARNTIFTYRQTPECTGALKRFVEALRPGGFLFVGSHDRLPPGMEKRFCQVGRTLWRRR